MRHSARCAVLIAALAATASAQKKQADKSQDASTRSDNKESQAQAGSGFDGNSGYSTARPKLDGRTPEVNKGSVPDMIGERQMSGQGGVFPNGTGCNKPPIPDADIPATYLTRARKIQLTQTLSQNAKYFRQLLGICKRKDEIMNKSCRPAVTNPEYAKACEDDKKFVQERCGMSPEEMQKNDWVMRSCEYEVTRREWKRVRDTSVCGTAEDKL
ncbi:MAG: hypothetical protein HY078_03400 [Elusimicrobia bacterium]|nr:hypothetical protein [Elusimicrobiota bacterium]